MLHCLPKEIGWLHAAQRLALEDLYAPLDLDRVAAGEAAEPGWDALQTAKKPRGDMNGSSHGQPAPTLKVCLHAQDIFKAAPGPLLPMQRSASTLSAQRM